MKDGPIIDVAVTSNSYARAKLDAELIVNLCAGISQLSKENEELKKNILDLESKLGNTSKKETPKSA